MIQNCLRLRLPPPQTPIAGLCLTRLGFEKIFKTQRVFKKAGQLFLQLLVQNIETISS